MSLPKKGDIGVCSAGALGLITQDGKQPVLYGDGNKDIAYVGIHLTDKIAPIGSPWSSRNPIVIGHISADLIRISEAMCGQADITYYEEW